MFFYYYGGFTGMLILIPAMILAFAAQAKVSSTFAKYSKINSARGYTGAEVARELLAANKVRDIPVEPTGGRLTDNYDPRNRRLRLSQAVYGSKSIAAIAVAAHETGHAVQDEEEYAFLRLRSFFVPIANFGSNAALPLILVGLFMGGNYGNSVGYSLIQLGIILFGLAVLFYLITLPVEFNASRRAIEMLGDSGILTEDEIVPAKKVLSAAAMTYVASAAVALANLLRFMLIFGGGGRRRD